MRAPAWDQLPSELVARAHAVGSGELFWPLGSVGTAIEALTAGRIAIDGGEVHIGRGRLWGSIELEWTTLPAWAPGTAWDDHVAHGRAQALAVLQRSRDLEAAGSQAQREPMLFLAIATDPTSGSRAATT